MLAGKDVQFLCVGRKGYDILKRGYREQIVELIDFKSVRKISFAEAQLVGDKVVGRFEAGEFDVATLYYSEFRNVISQVPTGLQLIPAAPVIDEDEDTELKTEGGGVYEYEPGAAEILDALVPRNIRVQIFRALLENDASEQGARMTAMDNATRNAGDMIDRLTLQFNRTRQAQMTTELIEIISGAELLSAGARGRVGGRRAGQPRVSVHLHQDRQDRRNLDRGEPQPDHGAGRHRDADRPVRRRPPPAKLRDAARPGPRPHARPPGASAAGATDLAGLSDLLRRARADRQELSTVRDAQEFATAQQGPLGAILERVHGGGSLPGERRDVHRTVGKVSGR